MKKSLLVLLATLLCLPAFSQQKVKRVKVDPDSTVKEYVQYRTRANHWSLMGSLGIGRLDGDQVQARENMFPTTFDKLNGILNIEYTFSPIWGVYLEYLYAPYGGFSRYVNQNIGVHNSDVFKFHGRNHEFTLGASVNVLNLFYNCRPQKWQWYLNVGGGVSFYDMRYHENFPDATDPMDGDGLNVIPSDNNPDKKDFLAQSKSLSIPVGTTIEWNATRWLAVLANFQYRFHQEDNYDASVRGNTDDGYAFAGLGLRWKINSLKHKNYMHVRDMAMCQYEPNMADENAREALRRVKEMEPVVDDLKNKVEDLEPRVKALEDDMENLRDSDGDGIPDIRDREPNTPKDVTVNSFGETVRPDQNRGADMGADNCLRIYYNTDKYNILPVSEVTLAEVARRLAADPSLKVEINSYADEQGVKNRYNNQKLTDRRADDVRKHLIKKYGVDASRIVYSKGNGVVKGAPSIDYLPNRRTDVCFVK